MKRLVAALGLTIAISSCNSNTISPKKLIGKWCPTYEVQRINEDGNWGEWITINTLMALPPIEFKNNGDYLVDGKPGAGCCYAGNKYSVTDNTITFTDTKSCPEVMCIDNTKWKINRLNSETLIIEVRESRSKFSRVK